MIRQRKPFRRKDGLVLYFETTRGVSTPRGDEGVRHHRSGGEGGADLWPRIASAANSIV